jgi:hypothetical protein
MSMYFNAKVISNLLGSFALLSSIKKSDDKPSKAEKQIETSESSKLGKESSQRSYNTPLSFKKLAALLLTSTTVLANNIPGAMAQEFYSDSTVNTCRNEITNPFLSDLISDANDVYAKANTVEYENTNDSLQRIQENLREIADSRYSKDGLLVEFLKYGPGNLPVTPLEGDLITDHSVPYHTFFLTIPKYEKDVQEIKQLLIENEKSLDSFFLAEEMHKEQNGDCKLEGITPEKKDLHILLRYKNDQQLNPDQFNYLGQGTELALCTDSPKVYRYMERANECNGIKDPLKMVNTKTGLWTEWHYLEDEIERKAEERRKSIALEREIERQIMESENRKAEEAGIFGYVGKVMEFLYFSGKTPTLAVVLTILSYIIYVVYDELLSKIIIL